MKSSILGTVLGNLVLLYPSWLLYTGGHWGWSTFILAGAVLRLIWLPQSVRLAQHHLLACEIIDRAQVATRERDTLLRHEIQRVSKKGHA